MKYILLSENYNKLNIRWSELWTKAEDMSPHDAKVVQIDYKISPNEKQEIPLRLKPDVVALVMQKLTFAIDNAKLIIYSDVAKSDNKNKGI